MLNRFALFFAIILSLLNLPGCCFLDFGQRPVQQSSSSEVRTEESGSAIPTSAVPDLPDAPVSITTPGNGAVVAHRELVRGTVVYQNAVVVLIIRPLDIAEYFVQPQVMVTGSTWVVQPYFANHSSQNNKGKHFLVMAVVNPKDHLRDGMRLGDWPEGQAKSQIIEVIRN